MVIADMSPSTRCGIAGVPIAAAIARSIATLGMSAVSPSSPVGPPASWISGTGTRTAPRGRLRTVSV